MSDQFQYDVFLSHSAKDKPVVRPLAASLRQDGLRVWFDEWEIKPGDSIPAKIEEGLEHSRVLVLFMSANAFGSDWAQLEAGTFRFRDPLNKERRFIPLRLDDAPVKGSLAQFLYVNWRPADREQEYARLLESCRQPENWPTFCQRGGPMATPSPSLGLLEASMSEGQRLLAKPSVTVSEHQIWEESALGAVRTAFPNDAGKHVFFLAPRKRGKSMPYREALKTDAKRLVERIEILKEQVAILASFIRQIRGRVPAPQIPARTLQELQPERETQTEDISASRWTSCAHFFHTRFAKAFPGLRSQTVWFNDASTIASRLERLLAKPLVVGNYSPIWWFRGSSSNSVEHFRPLDGATLLLNDEELLVDRIAAVEHRAYWECFVYVEVKGVAPSGAYAFSEDELQEMRESRGYCWEEVCLFRGRYLRRAFFDDGAAEIDGEILDFHGKAELRQRYLSNYNFLLAAQDSPINNTEFDVRLETLLNEILAQPSRFSELVNEIHKLPKRVIR